MSDTGTSLPPPPPPPPPSSSSSRLLQVERPWYFKNGTIVLGFLLGIWPGLLLLAMRPPRSRRKTTISAAFVVLGLISAAFGGSDSNSGDASTKDSSNSDVTKTTTTQPSTSYKEFLKPGLELASVLKPLCKKTSTLLAVKNAKYEALISSGTKNQDDPYAAQGLIQKVSWWGMNSPLENETLDQVVATIPTYFAALFTDAGIAESKATPVGALFSRQIGNDLIALCDLETVKTAVDSKTERLRALRILIQSRASNIPWYPRGYSEFEPGLAFRWLSSGQFSCSYSGGSCWGMSVTSQTGCSSLYVEITILDSAGNNIGYTNDTTSGLQAGQNAKLTFDSFEDGASKARIAKISCY
jgi:hypothetical protein